MDDKFGSWVDHDLTLTTLTRSEFSEERRGLPSVDLPQGLVPQVRLSLAHHYSQNKTLKYFVK